MSIIACETLSQFVTVCAELVREGITFTADATTLTIQMTGGY